MLNVCFALMTVKFIYWCFVVGSVILFNLIDRVVPYSAGSGVKSVIFCKNIVE